MDGGEPFMGHRACAGCGGALAVRIALKALGRRAVAVLPAGCMSAVGFNFPQLCFSNNAIISTFAGTASMMTGIAAGLRARGERDFKVVGFAGDGGTADIGIQALSGAIDRGDDMIYICYDNEGYMNTGTQRSSLTPYGARTTTTPAAGGARGNRLEKKNMLEIVAAHGIPYAATASVGYLRDYARKVEKAAAIEGPSYIQVLAPCPTGWGADPSETIDLAREAVDCGLWPLAEFEGGRLSLGAEPRDPSLLRAHLARQARFAHLTDGDLRRIEEGRDRRLDRMRGRAAKEEC
ncbi:MAG: pyruvate synthase subunit beta [Candidatus Methanoplasma sp.]|jgi:pyruvate ferredoxin oxidoreductase beta subunit|nr:pyruvate synthase subunit beta [Candidatus Methanoplasma sp.]